MTLSSPLSHRVREGVREEGVREEGGKEGGREEGVRERGIVEEVKVSPPSFPLPFPLSLLSLSFPVQYKPSYLLCDVYSYLYSSRCAVQLASAHPLPLPMSCLVGAFGVF